MANRGHIYVDYFMDCGVCNRETCLAVAREPSKEARRQGFTYTRKHGWVCPDCQREQQEQQEQEKA